MAAWTGAGFLVHYIEPTSGNFYAKWTLYANYIASRNVTGNVSGSGQVFP